MKKIFTALFLMFYLSFFAQKRAVLWKDSLTYNWLIDEKTKKPKVFKEYDTIYYLNSYKDEFNNEKLRIKKGDTVYSIPSVYFTLLPDNVRAVNSKNTDKKNAVISGVIESNSFVLNKPKNYTVKKIGRVFKGDTLYIYDIKNTPFRTYAVLKHKNKDVFVPLYCFENYSEIKLKFISKKCHYYKNEIDEFNGTKKIITEIYGLDDYNTGEYRQIGVGLQKVGNEKFIRFYSRKDLGCASSYKNDRSFVKVKLENNQIVSFYHFGDTDCGDFSIIARLTQSDILKLKKSPIKSIRLSGTKYYHDIKKVEWKTFFIDKLNCIN